MIPLKYATASQEIPLGPFVDDSDGVTAETGLSIANTDIKLWKSGATSLANKNSGGATHISNGIYYAVLDATDTNTYGPLVIFVQESGALAVKVDCWVMEADAYDALFAASGTGHIDTDVNATADQVWDEAKAGHGSAGSFGEEVQDHALYSEIADLVWDEDLTLHDDADSAGEYLASAGGGSTPSAIADAVWDEDLTGHTDADSAGKMLQDIPGAQKGAIEYTYTITDAGANPIEGAEVWISTDSGGASVIWYGTSDASGIARASNDEKPWLDAGTYYAWVQHGSYSWSNPDTITVS